MLTSGDVVTLDLGVPEGSEAGLRRPAVVVTVATSRVEEPVGNVGPLALSQIRDTLVVLLDL